MPVADDVTDEEAGGEADEELSDSAFDVEPVDVRPPESSEVPELPSPWPALDSVSPPEDLDPESESPLDSDNRLSAAFWSFLPSLP